MDENYCALALALTSEIFLLPEEAFQALSDGKVTKRNRHWDEVVPEMIRMREQNISWADIAEVFGYSKNTCMCMVINYRKRNRVA